jgi:hypothetical protein
VMALIERRCGACRRSTVGCHKRFKTQPRGTLPAYESNEASPGRARLEAALHHR